MQRDLVFGKDLDLRTAKSSIAAILLVWVFALRYGAGAFANAFLGGGVWSVANLLLWRYLYYFALKSNGKWKTPVLLLVTVGKFFLIYAVGFWALKYLKMDPVGMLVGFGVPFLVVFLKALGFWLGFSKRRAEQDMGKPVSE